ncbi:hypothetical protein KRR26_10685 [Corallococcus sp. M34]|uniref:hypothetical protein n=1 Tax=Citreicoccus inhibens TaxID=2849499 RepID=UPI001C219339|nr:hypothetical protein [Citreicoccus inhibens]MBU8896074.1 hypothetical protein [Citreicoccus inhibens]
MRKGCWLVCVLCAMGCGKNESATVSLVPVDDSGISGTLTVEETEGKAGLGEVRFAFTLDNPADVKTIGYVHEGRCTNLGMHEHTEGFEPDSYLRQAYAPREGHSFHLEHLDAYQDNHAFAVHAYGDSSTDASGRVLACGDI